MITLLCDDHVMFTEALDTVLLRAGHTVEVATRPAAAVERARLGGLDVVVMDRCFPDADGLDGVRAIRQVDPSIPIVVLSASVDAAFVKSAHEAGADLVEDKAQPLQRIIRVLELLADRVEVSLIEQVGARRPRRRSRDACAAEFLTQRERDVLACLVQGADTREIAAELGVAYATARTHIQNVLDKLGVHSRLEAAAYAVRHQVLEPL